MQETQVRFLGREDPLEKEMATHSSILAWRIPWTEEPDRLYSPCGCKTRTQLSDLTTTTTTVRENLSKQHDSRKEECCP